MMLGMVDAEAVRDTWFLHRSGWDSVETYVRSDVDDLRRRVAEELDASRPPGPVIQNATLRRAGMGKLWTGYDIDAVDWFLDELLRSDHGELGGISADPWRDVAVAQFTTQNRDKASFTQECQDAWRGFGQVPGTPLRWGRTERTPLAARYELRTAEQHAIASSRAGAFTRTVRVGERSFTTKAAKARSSGTPGASPPGTAEITDRSRRDHAGHFATKTAAGSRVGQLVDETGIPVLYTTGQNLDRRAWACLTFPDQRWLRFLVRGTRKTNAIMTAVDQAGNRVARYRQAPQDPPRRWGSVEITVHPSRTLTDELVLAIMESAEWLESYFQSSGGD
jgi:hypothetical protein